MSGGNTSSTLKDKAREVLLSFWDEVQRIPAANLEGTQFVKEDEIKNAIKRLINARTKAFRYALLNQVLAKVADSKLNCLVLQAGASIEGAFDARSLCKNVVIPFEQEHLGGTLGGSPDPYVSKPLRRSQVSPDAAREIKYVKEWNDLYTLLRTVEERHDPVFAQEVLQQILLEMRKLISQQPLHLPARISTEELRDILVKYLNEASLGLGPQAVTYSLLKVFNKRTGTFQEVTSASPTTADTPAGRVADIECRDKEGALRLAVCVTQRLDLQKLEHELGKCKRSGVTNVLFVAFEIAANKQEAYKKARQYDINVAIYDLVDFVVTITVLLNSEMRRELIEEIIKVLKEWGGARGEREFIEVVKEVLEAARQ